MPEAHLHGLDRLAVPDQERGVVVPQGVHAGSGVLVQPGYASSRAPDMTERLAGDRVPGEGEDPATVQRPARER